MDRKKTRILRRADEQDAVWLDASPAERLQWVWPLTLEITSLFGEMDAERRLQRDVAVLKRRQR